MATKREELVKALIEKRETIKAEDETAHKAPLASSAFYENEIEILAMLTRKELSIYAERQFPFMRSIIDLLPGDAGRTLAVLTVLSLQNISIGRIKFVQPYADGEEEKAARLGKLENLPASNKKADDGPPWESIAMALLSKRSTTCDEASRALKAHMGDKKGIDRFADLEVNRERMAAVIDKLRNGEFDGWCLKEDGDKVKAEKVAK